MKKAIVTGATGFIGSALVDHLTQSGVAVLAIGRRKRHEVPPARSQLIGKAEYLAIAMKDIDLLTSRVGREWASSGECVFFNLAWGGCGKLSDLNAAAQLQNIPEAVMAFATAEELGCSRFVQVGSMEEEFAIRYLSLDSDKSDYYNRHVIYANAKRLARMALGHRARQAGIQYNYVFNSHVMGPHDDKDSFLQVTLQKMLNGADLAFSSGVQMFDVVSVHDCVEAYRLVGMFGIDSATYWVGSGEPKELREYVIDMRNLVAPSLELVFGEMPFNDVVLEKEVFDIASLKGDTGYSPRWTFADMIDELRAHLLGLPESGLSLTSLGGGAEN